MHTLFARPISRLSLALPLLTLAACGGKAAPTPSYQAEMFSTGASPFARNYDATSQETCEASRRALLSQGYMTTMTQPGSGERLEVFVPCDDVFLDLVVLSGMAAVVLTRTVDGAASHPM